MPANDPVTDSLNYANAAGVSSIDFEEMLFEEIEESDLFWFSNKSVGESNPAFRKIDDTSALNTRSRIIRNNIGARSTIYQKI